MLDFIENLASSDSFSAVFAGPWGWLIYTACFFVGAGIALAWMSLMSIVWTYGERKIAGYIQGRLGPNRVGPWGILQPIADGIKLLSKEDTIPQVALKFLYNFAPLLVFIGALIPFAVLPFSERLVVVNMDLALFYILAFEALEVIGVLMAGWAPGSKWSLYGAMRLAAQMLSYEIPLGFCILFVVILTGSLNLIEIVNWQSTYPWIFGWTIFRSPVAPIAFLLFFIGGLAATKRAPFDLPEAESELVAGYHTEYSGMRFAFFFMAEYASMYLICALAAILFLGGWYGPIPNLALSSEISISGIWLSIASNNGAQGIVSWTSALISALFSGEGIRIIAHELIGFTNLMLKAFSLYFVMIWVRWTLPRIRIDHVMYLCLKVLLPFSVGCVLFALVQVVVWP